MAEQLDPSAFFTNDAAPKSVAAAPAQGKAGQLDPGDFFAGKASPTPPTTDEYEQQIQSKMPEARKIAKGLGTVGSMEAGITKIPIVGDIASEIGADVGAALPTSVSGATGETFSKRRQDIKAQFEAMNRATTEEHPYIKAGTEIAGSFALPFGKIAEPVEAIAAKYVPEFAARTLGMSAEGAGIAGLSAATKNYLGTQPEAENADISGEAKTGAVFGAALPAVGKVAGKLIPDWAKGLAGSDYQMNEFLSRVAADKAAGEDILGIDGALQAASRDQPVNPFNVGGTRTQQWLLKSFKGRGDALDNFTNTLQQKMSGSGDRFDAMLREMAGVDDEFNLDKLSQESKDYAQKLNDANYRKAAWLPDNGVGIWNSRWEPQMKDKYVRQAINDVNGIMSDIQQKPFASPIDRVGTKGVETLGLNQNITDALKGSGFNTLDDLSKVNSNKLAQILHPDYEGAVRSKLLDHLSQGFDDASPNKQKIADAVNNLSSSTLSKLFKSNNLSVDMPPEITNAAKQATGAIRGMDLDNMTLVRPQNLNVEYLDRLQRKLGSNSEALFNQDPSQNMVLVNRLRDLRKDIVGSMKGPTEMDGSANPYYNPKTYNQAFDQAHTQARQLFRIRGAFDMGRSFLNKLSNGLDASAIANSVPKMTDARERKMFIQGILGQMKAKGIQNGEMKYNLVNKYINDPNVAKSLESALGPQAYGKMRAFIRAEAIMNESLQRARQIEGAGRGSNILGIINKDAISYGISYMLDSHLPLLGFVYNHVINPYMGVKYASKLRNMLESGDLNQMSDAYDAIMRNPRAKNAFLDGLNTAVSANIGSPPRVPNNRMQRAEGGRIDNKKYGLGMGPEPLQSPKALLKPEDDVSKVGLIKDKTMDEASSLHKIGVIHWDKPVSAQDNVVQKTIRHRLNDFDIKERHKRATGGQIPAINKLFNSAKRKLDNGYNDGGEVEPKINNPMSVFPKPQRMFPEDAPVLGGQYLSMPDQTDMTGHKSAAASIGVNPGGKPYFTASRDAVDVTGTPGRGSATTKTNLFKQKAGWNWKEAPEGHENTNTIVSVEHRGQHHYALNAHFPKGVDFARYENSPSEPRLRPTTKGNVEFGPQAGNILVRGREHPVYHHVIVKNEGGSVKRPTRATGGRIPEVDKLFNAAKRELDNGTKPMLHLPDDTIVNALRIAQGRI